MADIEEIRRPIYAVLPWFLLIFGAMRCYDVTDPLAYVSVFLHVSFALLLYYLEPYFENLPIREIFTREFLLLCRF